MDNFVPNNASSPIKVAEVAYREDVGGFVDRPVEAVGESGRNRSVVGESGRNRSVVGESSRNRSVVGESSRNRSVVGESVGNQFIFESSADSLQGGMLEALARLDISSQVILIENCY
jgi:hypothetical protein